MWIEPLALEQWIIQIFSGNLKVFTAIAILFITGLAAYFRMTGLILMFMIVLFFTLFSGYVDQSVYFLLISIGGLLIGYWISKIVKN